MKSFAYAHCVSFKLLRSDVTVRQMKDTMGYLYRLSPPPKKKKYNRHLGIDCERILYGIWKMKQDYGTMVIFLQFSEDPIWFGQVVTKKYGFL